MTQSVIINGDERATSADINNLQSLITRRLAQIEQSRIGQRNPTRLLDGVLHSAFDGCAVGSTGIADELGINPGVLYQFSLTWPAAPGPLESATRIGLQLAAGLVPGLPVPGGDTWYLLEARVLDQVTVTAFKDIFNPATQTFVPTNVPKQMEVSIEFQFVAGDAVNIPLPSGDPWVPLAGIFRPAGGGVVTVSNVVDLRQLGTDVGSWMVDDSVHAFDNTYAGSVAPGSSDTTRVTANFKGTVQGRGVGVSGESAPVSDGSGFVPTDRESHFLCLVTGNGFTLTPRTIGPLVERLEGLLVRTSIGTGLLNRANAFVIPPPVPFGNYTCAVGDALLVASPINVSATNFKGFSQSAGGTLRLLEPVNILTAVSAAVPHTVNPDFRTKIPSSARTLRWRLRLSGTLGAGPDTVQADVAPFGFAAPVMGTALANSSGPNLPLDATIFETPAQGNGSDGYQQLAIAVTTGGPITEAAEVIELLGWTM